MKPLVTLIALGLVASAEALAQQPVIPQIDPGVIQNANRRNETRVIEQHDQALKSRRPYADGEAEGASAERRALSSEGRPRHRRATARKRRTR